MQKYNKGEIWVRVVQFESGFGASLVHGSNKGDIVEIYETSNTRINYSKFGNNSAPENFRPAAQNEIEAFRRGINKVSDIKMEPLKVGDIVVCKVNYPTNAVGVVHLGTELKVVEIISEEKFIGVRTFPDSNKNPVTNLLISDFKIIGHTIGEQEGLNKTKDLSYIKFKFKVGDFVRVIESGWGLEQRYVGKEFTIAGLAQNSSLKHPTYELSEQGSILRIAEQGIQLVTEPESLLKEAKRRYPVGTRYIPAHLINSPHGIAAICTIAEDDEFTSDRSNGVDISAGNIPKNGHNYSETLYRYDGNRWAKIVGVKDDNKARGVTPSIALLDEAAFFPNPHHSEVWMPNRSIVDIMRPYSQAIHAYPISDEEVFPPNTYVSDEKGDLTKRASLWDSVGNVKLDQKDYIAGWVEAKQANLGVILHDPSVYERMYQSRLEAMHEIEVQSLLSKSKSKSTEFKPKLFKVPRI